ncbi:MAG TPA: hypothetical protein VLY46_15175 [Usitatibacter sp.]|nr:hypothetical protein [Usitatibacter sp.]
MNLRTCSSPAACWRQRFLAIARQAEAAEPRPAIPAGLRVRTRTGYLVGRRPGAALGRT